MKLPHDIFESLLSSASLEVSFSLYHECLHSIAFTHAKVLSLPQHKFIDPSSPTNADRTISVQFLPHWRQVLLLPLFLCLLRLYLKPQLHLSDADYQLMVDSFNHLLAAEVSLFETFWLPSTHPLVCHFSQTTLLLDALQFPA